MIKSVIFDFDGVIADTMHDNYNAWQNAFLYYGFENFNKLKYFRLEGMGTSQIANYFIKEYSLDIDIKEGLISFKEEYYKKNNTFKIFSYIREILIYLNKLDIRIAIVSGASKERLYDSLPDDIYNKIEIIISGDDVIETKPNPEPYLKAIGRLNLIPEECLVIENAILGIQSAKAANCICFAIESTLTKDDLIEADFIYKDHESLYLNLIKYLEISNKK
jgi:beta-phosphoglucomutase